VPRGWPGAVSALHEEAHESRFIAPIQESHCLSRPPAHVSQCKRNPWRLRTKESSGTPAVSLMRQRVLGRGRRVRNLWAGLATLVQMVRAGWLLTVGALAAFAVGCGGASPGKSVNLVRAPAQKQLSVPEIAKRARSSVVVVRTTNGLGTGFVVAPGVIATNLHVIARASEISIDVSPTVTSPVTWIMGFDPAHDLALVYVGAALELEPVKLGDDTLVRAGDLVVAVGTPQGFELSVSTGVVSAVRTLDENTTLLQVTAPISSGSSAGRCSTIAGR
jgi:S1-C subfamily serine protease